MTTESLETRENVFFIINTSPSQSLFHGTNLDYLKDRLRGRDKTYGLPKRFPELVSLHVDGNLEDVTKMRIRGWVGPKYR